MSRGANADRTEIAPVGGQDAVNVAALGDRGHRPIDESQIELPESGVKLERASDIGGKRQFVLIAGCRIEDLRDQFAHHSPFGSEKVVHLRKNEGGDDDYRRGDQNPLVVGEAGLAFWCPGKRAEQATRIGNDRRDQTSRSRKSSDSSPSFAFVDSNRSVEGDRFPE